MPGPKAPRDAVKKRPGFYTMYNKEVAGSVQPDGRGIQFIYLNDGRMVSSARIVGNVTDEEQLLLLTTAAGFRRLVHSIGVSVEMAGEAQNAGETPETVDFVFQVYGKTDPGFSGTTLRMPVKADGLEHQLVLEECEWSEDDDIPGQIRFEFRKAGQLAIVNVKLYLNEGYDAPEWEEEAAVDFASPYYQEMLEKSLLQTGCNVRLKRALAKARAGEDVTVAFIGGSITQGAGAIPINTQCYAYKTFQGFCKLAGRKENENIHYIKAGAGGTSSELGLVRYERDVLRDGTVSPDVVIVEFAVNDEGDETRGECYDSLVRKILLGDGAPAVILLFAVFADDWNLQERLIPVGQAYHLPMVSIRDCVVEQFYQPPGKGRVVSKAQYFYDRYHPTNVGHTVMASGLLYLLEKVDAMPEDMENVDISQVKPPYGSDFEQMRLLDRKENRIGAVIDCGDFSETDTELQAVEQDMKLVPVREFPYNWKYSGSSKGGGHPQPFRMEITCRALVLIFKDSGAVTAGCGEVYGDGEKVFTANPRINGWTHCNPVICLRASRSRMHQVEIRMAQGDEHKDFTILGFGYV